jgi:hypothetical protein
MKNVSFHSRSWGVAAMAVALTAIVAPVHGAEVVVQAQAGGAVIIQGNAGNVRVNINGVQFGGATLGGLNSAPGVEKPPLAPEAEKELADLLTKLKEAKRKVWEKRMEKEMDDMVQQTGMGEAERKALAEPAKQAIGACVDMWLEKMDVMLRKNLQRSPRAATQMFLQYRQNAETYAETDVVPGVKQPIDNPAWVDAWKKILTPQHLEGWKKVVVKREAAAREEMKDVLKPFEERFQMQFDSVIGVRTAEIKEALKLPADRAKALDELGKKAVAQSMAAWQKRVQASIVSMPDQRRKMMLQGRLFFGNERAESPELQPAWTEGLAKLLSAAELKQMDDVRAEHKSRRVAMLAQLFLVYLDEKLALTESQRQRLRPIAEKLVQTQPSLFPQENDENNFNNFAGSMTTLSPRAIMAAGVNAPEKEVRAIIEDVQWEHWKKACQPQNDEYGMASADEPKEVPTADPGDPEPVEALVSNFMATRSVRQRGKMASMILLQAEDAARVAKLSPEAYERLQIGARGAAEKALQPWKVQFEQIVRGNLGEVTPQTLKLRLQQMDNFNSYQVPGDKPPQQAVWKKAVERELTPAQRAAWDKEVEARKQFRDKTIVGAILAEFDRQVPLRKEQWEKLEPMMVKIISEYTDEIGQFFSFSEGSAWYLQNYTRFMPIAGIPEEELKTLLSKEQWERWSTTEEFANAKNYWNNIRQNHQNRRR